MTEPALWDIAVHCPGCHTAFVVPNHNVTSPAAVRCPAGHVVQPRAGQVPAGYVVKPAHPPAKPRGVLG